MSIKYFKIAVIIILVQIFLSFYIGLSLPDDAKVPTHWNFKGEVNGWSGKWTAILLFPGINLIILLLAFFFPAISPRYRNDPERFQRILPSFINILVFFFAVIHIYSLLLAKGTFPLEGNFILIVIGLMFVCLGNILPKLPSSFYIGIRTPWTLSSEHVWRKTHKTGGICFVLSGLLMIFLPAIWSNNALVITLMFILVMSLILFTVVYSFILYKRSDR